MKLWTSIVSLTLLALPVSAAAQPAPAAPPPPAAAEPPPAAAAPPPAAEPPAAAPPPAAEPPPAAASPEPAPPPPPAVEAPPPMVAQPPAPPTPDQATPPEAKKPDRGAFVAGGKFGGIASFNGLGPFVNGALEVGYILPFLNRGLGIYVDAAYTVPTASGEGQDPRVPGGSYSWTLTQKQLSITPMVVYRFTKLGRLVPYVGLGARIYMMESITEGMSGNQTILETKERSTKVGMALPLGVDFKIGPGALLAELLFELGPLDHRLTGETSTAATSLALGYRLML